MHKHANIKIGDKFDWSPIVQRPAVITITELPNAARLLFCDHYRGRVMYGDNRRPNDGLFSPAELSRMRCISICTKQEEEA